MMQTSDFISRMKVLGLDVKEIDDTLIIEALDGRFIATASRGFNNIINTDSIHFRALEAKTQEIILEYLLRYAVTPIAEREGPKYVYRFKVPVATDNPATMYVRRFEPEGVKGVILDTSSADYVFSSRGAHSFHFTDEQVKGYPTEMQFLFELCYKEAVIHESGGHQKLLD